MSEPMSTHEIEDVLSSIRRLVSEDLRPSPHPAPKPDTTATTAPAPDSPEPSPQAAPASKLLLTPALRVVDDAAEAAAAPADPITADPIADDSHAALADRSPDPADMVSRLGAAVGDDDEDWESPVGDPPAWDDAARDHYAGPHARLHFRATGEDLDGPPSTFLDTAPPGFADEAGAAPEPEYDLDEAEEVAEPVAAPRRTVAPPSDDWADAAEAEVRASLEREIPEEAASMFSEAEASFDEEVLRDLVRDIIREELAGSLGERITRNVRKLVRAEIARAMAVRDFE